MPSTDFLRLIEDATALTRAGDLHAATAKIQRALAGNTPTQDGGDVIDVVARWVPDSAPASGTPRSALSASADTRASSDTPASAEAPAPTASPAPSASPRHPDGEFIAGRFGEGTSARDYKLYVPPAASVPGGGALPLVVLLHGCTQNPDDFAAGTRMNDAAREQGFFVLYPAQSKKANPQGCWNWFKHSHQSRGRGEPEILAGMALHIAVTHAVDASRVYVAGLSAGGAMAAILGQTYPELFAAVGVHSGLPAGAARDLPSALHAMKAGARGKINGPRVPTIVVHGDNDATVHPDNGLHVHTMSTVDGMPVDTESGRAPGGHEWTRRVQRDAGGNVVAEHWVVHGAGHAWSGGSARGSYTDPKGPDATAAMLKFFLAHRAPAPGAR